MGRDSTYDGTNNGATTGATGKIGNAWDFDGSNDYVSLPLGTAFDGLAGATISGWVNWDSSGGTYQTIFGVGDSDSERMEVTIEQGGNIYLYAGNGNVAYSFIPVSNLPSGAWHHVAVVYDGTLTNDERIQMYIDGSLITNTSTSNTHGTTLGTFTNDGSIGKRPHGTHYFKGLQDEVVFYNKALTSTEVSALYNGGSGDSTPDTNGMVAHYNFEQTGSLEDQRPVEPTNTKLLNLNDVTFNVGTTSASVDEVTTTYDNYWTFPNPNDNDNDSVSIGSATDWKFLSNDNNSFTISTWLKNDDVWANGNAIMSTTSGSASNGMIFDVRTGGDIRFVAIGSINNQFSVGLSDSNWHHYVLTYDDSTSQLKLYVDNVLKGTVNQNISGSTTPDVPLQLMVLLTQVI